MARISIKKEASKGIITPIPTLMCVVKEKPL